MNKNVIQELPFSIHSANRCEKKNKRTVQIISLCTKYLHKIETKKMPSLMSIEIVFLSVQHICII